MKQKSIILTFLVGMISLSSCSEDDSVLDPNVPGKVQQEFKSRYPNVTDVQWDVVKNYHVARFNAPQTRAAAAAYNTSAWFTESGQYCQTDEDIAFENLPVVVQEAFNDYKLTFYPDWEIDDCEVLVREGMSSIFVIEIELGDLEREISISEAGDILKDVLDDDDEDEVLPILIPDEVYAALESIFPETYSELSILELEIDEDEIEIDVMESNRHKEVELNAQYNLVSIEYEVSFEEVQQLLSEELFQKMVEMAKEAGIDVYDEEIQKQLEIEVKETAKGYSFEIEIEINDVEYKIEIDEDGNMKLKN